MPSYTSGTPVRETAGVSETNDISDSELATIIDVAERYMIDDIIIWTHDEELTGDINGSNTKYAVRHEPVGDREVLGAMGGSPADVTVYSHTIISDGPDDFSELSVSLVDRRRGEVVLDSAPTDPVDNILADYGYYTKPIREDQLKNAATYLTAHLVLITMEKPDKVTLADVEENSLVVEQNRTRFLDQYNQTIRKAKAGVMGAGY